MIGILERYKVFVLSDVPRLCEAEFKDITAEQAPRIEAQLGLDQLRDRCVKLLGRTVADHESWEDLVDEVVGRHLEQHDQHRHWHWPMLPDSPRRLTL